MTDEAGKGKTFPETDATFTKSPRIILNDLVLNSLAKDAAQQLINEQKQASILRNHSIEPRNRMLLSGYVGNGQELFAEAIAEELGNPFYKVLYDTLLNTSLEEVKKTLNEIFNFVQKHGNCVLFFDEFNSFGNEYGDEHKNETIKSIVSYLLMKIDQLPSWVVVVVATNVTKNAELLGREILGREILRHFQFCLDFPEPLDSNEQFQTFVEKMIDQWTEKPSKSAFEIARHLLIYNYNYAETFDFLQSVKRRHMLSLNNITINGALEIELALLKKRFSLSGRDDDPVSITRATIEKFKETV